MNVISGNILTEKVFVFAFITLIYELLLSYYRSGFYWSGIIICNSPLQSFVIIN